MKIELIGTGSVIAPQLSACTLIDDKLLNYKLGEKNAIN